MKQETLDFKITQWARRCPGKTAIKTEKQSISYLDLEKNSNRIANFMKGKIKEIPHVIIILDRSPRLIQSIIGLLKKGLVFVPLNPLFPANRVKKMIEETRAEWVITTGKYYEKFRHILDGDSNGTGGNSSTHLKTLLMDAEGDGFDFTGNSNLFYLDPGIESHKLTFDQVFNKNCYIYFTSGSTGVPKAVLGRQKSLVHFIQWEMNEFGVDESFNISQLTPPSFDPFLRDIFLPLLAGGISCIPSDNTLMNMRELVRWIDENHITLIHTVPSLFKEMVSHIKDSHCFFNLEYILLAGELLRGNDIYKFIEIFNDRIQLVNVYGPTETTLAKLFYRIKPGDVNRTIIPVGKPIANTQVLILDRKKQKCRIGKKGEIYIRTPFISSGYYNDPALNEKLFIKNPYGKHPKDIIYKTGDLGRVLPDGNIELSGRIDFQVKIRGVRIELGEIENRLLKHNDVEEAVVTANHDESGDIYLYAYIVPVQGKEPGAPVLRGYLSKDLPAYMIPNFFVQMENIPLTSSGKIDRSALPVPGISAGESYVAPGDKLEEKLVIIWSEELGLKKEVVGIDSNFFDLGGQSLKASGMAAKIHKTLNVKLPLTEVFKYPTIKKLAQRIKGLSRDIYASIEPAEEKEYYALSSNQERLYVLQQMDLNSTAYNIPLAVGMEGEPAIEKIDSIFKKLITRHEALRTSFRMISQQAYQEIHPVTDMEFEIQYPSMAQDAGRKEVNFQKIIHAFLKPFDLSQVPLFRVNLLKIEEAKYLLMIDIHHIISDGTSIAILMKKFMTLYDGIRCNPLRIRYKDYLEWQDYV